MCSLFSPDILQAVEVKGLRPLSLSWDLVDTWLRPWSSSRVGRICTVKVKNIVEAD